MEINSPPNAATVDHNASSSATLSKFLLQKLWLIKTRTAFNLSPGAGIEVHINKNMFVRAEYSFFGPKFNLACYNNCTQSLTRLGTGVNHNLKTTQHAVKVGLGYKF